MGDTLTFNIHETKTHLSRILQQMEAGHEITIARAGKPVACLIPAKTATKEKPRRIGFLKGQISYTEDWDSPATNAAIYGDWYEKSLIPD